MVHPSVKCPHCGGQILVLAPTPKLRAALTLAGDLGEPRASRRAPRQTTEASSPQEAKPSAGEIDRGALRRAIFRKHGTNTVAAAEEWAKWQKDNPA